MNDRGVWWLRLALAVAVTPLAAGYLNVTYQDASMTHLPGKWATVELLRVGEFPYLNPYASFGQPLAGNPNFGTFFPDTLLFLLLPLRLAFGLHFALAALLAYVGARRWARAEDHGRGAAEAAAVAFVLSGVFVSAWKFYNTGMALAVAPWVLAAAAKTVRRADDADRRRRRRAVAELGAWSALEVFAGEPVVALLTFLLVLARTAAERTGRVWPAVVGGLALGALLAAPQVLLTAQIYRDSSRDQRPFPFVTATGTSIHPVRFVEQAVPFPFGRPDLAGAGGFTGHAFHDNHTPYLWTLHLGLATLVLLALHGHVRRGPEGLWYAIGAVAIVLSFGRYLPSAKQLYPLLSAGGRIRFPVKWWYVVALCLVPLVAAAAGRWLDGDTGSRRRHGVVAAMIVVAIGAAGWMRADAFGWAGLILAAAGGIFLTGARRRSSAPLAAALGVPLLIAGLPLLLAVLDRPLPDPPPVTGRILERVRVDSHALPGSVPPPEWTTREVMRRIAPELWSISGALSGASYAFDRDPDGSYTDPDRAVRKALDDMTWSDRVPRLRLSGVTHVVTDEALSPPYREARLLSAVHGVRLYTLDGAAASVRLMDGRFLSVRERATSLRVEVETAAPGLLVWSRSYFGAWRASVDGAPAEVTLAEGHLVGVAVPAGSRRVEISWPNGALLAGAGLFVVGAIAAAVLRLP
jgi:hypothetical protein